MLVGLIGRRGGGEGGLGFCLGWRWAAAAAAAAAVDLGRIMVGYRLRDNSRCMRLGSTLLGFLLCHRIIHRGLCIFFQTLKLASCG